MFSSKDRDCKKIQIRTGGFAFWFMSFLILFFLFIFLGCIIQLFFTDFSVKMLIENVLGLALLAFFIIYLYTFINGNRIILDAEKLTTYDATMHGKQNRGWAEQKGLCIPVSTKYEVFLDNIGKVILGSYQDMKEIENSGVDEYINKKVGCRARSLARLASFLLVMEKNKAQHYLYVEPYAKKDIMKLIDALSVRQIDILVTGDV